MALELIVAAEAEHDLAEAYAWYEQRGLGLGEEFLVCVDACVQRILRLPESFPVVHESYRRGLVRRFPYAVFYEYDGKQVIIYSVFHCSQNPDKWRRRLP